MSAAYDCIVVGAGPAGTEAAVTAARYGASVALVDLQRHVGGQYGMPALVPAQAAADGPALGRSLAQAVGEAGVTTYLGAEVFAAERGFRLGVNLLSEGRAEVLEAPVLVVATGAQERVVPFTGWTLPGVMTAGALQRFLKAGAVPDRARIVLAGSGVFLAAVAQTMLKAGRRFSAIVHPRIDAISAARALATSPQRWGEARTLAMALARAGEARLANHTIIAGMGGDRLEAVRVAPLRPDGSPDETAATDIACDTLAITHGFIPVIELAASLGARLAFDEGFGGWHVATDPATGATDIPGLYAAGETAGVAGAASARLGGTIAGLGVAARLGLPHQPAAGAVRAYQRQRQTARKLARVFPDPGAAIASADGSTVLCRCEGVTVGEVRAAIAEGAATVANLRTWTRAGMGYCQGRICGANARALLSQATGVSEGALGLQPARFPVRPAPLDAVLDWSSDDG